ncbi:hypothetical protein Rs2_30406 [Raphanus sativus]|nr:hypothetical protein Rs2_30406 [Raphanus sativus]
MEGENKETKLARSSVDLRQLECWKVAKLSRRSSGRSRGSGSVKVEVIGAGEAEPYNTVRTIALRDFTNYIERSSSIPKDDPPLLSPPYLSKGVSENEGEQLLLQNEGEGPRTIIPDGSCLHIIKRDGLCIQVPSHKSSN